MKEIKQPKTIVLQKIQESQAKLRTNKAKPITFAKALLARDGKPLFYPRTINVIQGKAGSHKSRLAETICAAILSITGNKNKLLDFERSKEHDHTVCFVDTERNLSDQLPFALQTIQTKAGFEIEENPARFEYLSLLEFEREERFEALNYYLEELRSRYNGHLFVVLDVITDCVYNFNDSKDSMKLIDMMNRTINHYDVTFLCLIHENPGRGEKARGHLGTEIINKASTVMQIGFVNDSRNQRTDLVKVSFLKCRNSRKHDSFFVEYSEKEGQLVAAGQELISAVQDQRNIKAHSEKLLNAIGEVLSTELSRRELIKYLCEELNCSKRTIVLRLKQVVKDRSSILLHGKEMELKTKTDKKELIYFLEEKPKDECRITSAE